MTISLNNRIVTVQENSTGEYTSDTTVSIVENKIKKLKLKYRNVKISVSKTVIRELVDLSEYKDFGARKLDKIIASKLENIIIDGIINNKEIIKINKLKLENYN